MQNKAIRTVMGFLLALAMLVSYSAAPANAATNAKAANIAIATMKNKSDLKHYRTGEVYNGTYVVLNCGSYCPVYWVHNGKAYAVDGVAMNASPGIKKAPPSIKWDMWEDAIDGKLPATVATFGVSPATLAEYVNNGMEGRKSPVKFKKETYFSYTLSENGSLVGQLTTKELGGEVTEAHLEIDATSKLWDYAVNSVAFTFIQTEDSAKINKTFSIVADAQKNNGKEYSAKLDGKKFAVTQKGKYFNMVITPAN